MFRWPFVFWVGLASFGVWSFAAGAISPTPQERAMLEGRFGAGFHHAAVVWRAASSMLPEEALVAVLANMEPRRSEPTPRETRTAVIVRAAHETVVPSWRVASRGGAKFISRR